MTPPLAVFPELAAALRGSPLLILLDIDGTLCDIVPDPSAVRIPPETRIVLEQLVQLPGVKVALVTGRSVADAGRIAALSGVYIFGNHGIEAALPSGEVEVDNVAATAAQEIRKLAAELTEILPEYPGVQLEDKRYTLSLHYRQASDGVVERLDETVHRLAASGAIRVTQGNCIFDIRPSGAADKGVAVLRFVRELNAAGPNASVLFAGDDVTDEDAFRALREELPRAVTVRVGSRVANTAARYSVPDITTMRKLLQAIAATRVSGDSSSGISPAGNDAT